MAPGSASEWTTFTVKPAKPACGHLRKGWR